MNSPAQEQTKKEEITKGNDGLQPTHQSIVRSGLRLLDNEIVNRFAEFLEDRFSKGVFTTEDSIRYTFFHCLVSFGDLHPSDIVLEYPHSNIPQAKVDAYILPKDGRIPLAFEFKFDRIIPSGKNLPRPQKAGAVFRDIMRLAFFSPNETKLKNDNSGISVKRFLAYVTDGEMTSYFRNESNRLCDFFDLLQQRTLRIDKPYVDRHCQTFVKSVGTWVTCEITCLLSREFRTGESLRFYEVKVCPKA